MKKIIGIAVVTIGLCGCGYTFQGRGSVLPPDVKKVYIPLAENTSTEAGLSVKFTEAVRDRFERFGVVAVVDQAGEADAVLRSKIVQLRRSTGAVTSKTDYAVKLDDTMTVAAELRRTSGPVLWSSPGFSVTSSYGSVAGTVVTSSADFAASGLGAGDLSALQQGSGSREVARGQQSAALDDLCEKAAKIIYDSAVAPDF